MDDKQKSMDVPVTAQAGVEGSPTNKDWQNNRLVLRRFNPDRPTDVQILRPLVMSKQIYVKIENRKNVGLKTKDVRWIKRKGNELPGYHTNHQGIDPEGLYYFAIPHYAGVAKDEGVRQHIIATATDFFKRADVPLQVIDRALPHRPESHRLTFVLPASALEDEAARARIREAFQPLYDAAISEKRGAAR